jgi:integrase
VGRSDTRPFEPARVAARAYTAWKAADLAGVTLQEARHSYASMLIAAGTEPRTVMELMGHSSVTITFDLYVHLFPGTHARTGQQLQAYIEADLRGDGMAHPEVAAAAGSLGSDGELAGHTDDGD